MKTRYPILLCFAALGIVCGLAQAPDGYYKSAEGKSQSALKSQLYTIVKDHTPITYGNGLNQTWGAFYSTDVHPDGYWWDIYTTNQVKVGDSAPDNNTMNKEHSFPKSWWGGGNNDAYKDIVHLMPVNSVANSTRSNWPYAEVGSSKSISSKCTNPRFKYGSPKPGQGGGCETVFEPDDEFKGDLARTYFYMVTCYQNLTWQGNGTYTAQNGIYPTLQPWAIEMLLRWHRNDPVSQKELDRNEGVYKEQGNRNPFIDHPELAEHIWGDKMDEPWHATQQGIDPPVPVTGSELTSPIAEDVYDFGQVMLGQTAEMYIPVLGTELAHSITAKLEGEDPAYSLCIGNSHLEAVSISAPDVCSPEGYQLKVQYKPRAVTPDRGFDYADITFSGADLEEDLTIHLRGKCIEGTAPAAVTVLPVEDADGASYTLRWIPCAGEVEGYTVTRKVYATPTDTEPDTYTYETSAEDTSLAITDRDPSTLEVLSVKAHKDGLESPMGNEVRVEPASGIDSAADTPQAGTLYFDVTGMRLPAFPATPGIYIIKTSNSTKTVSIR